MGLFKKLVFGSVGERLIDMGMEKKNTLSRIKALEERAAANIESGKIVYEKAYNNTLQTIRETENIISKHMEFRSQVAAELGEKIELRLLKLDINRLNTSVPEIKEKITNLVNITHHEVVKPFNTFDVFKLLTSVQDYKHAEEQLDKAILYYKKMRMEAEKLNLYRDKLKAICKYLACEEEEIKILLKKIEDIFVEIENRLKQRSIRFFAFKERKRMNELKIIIKQIVTIIKNNFLEENFEVNKSFIKQLEVIKHINQTLPEAPVLRENEYSIKLIDGKVY